MKMIIVTELINKNHPFPNHAVNANPNIKLKTNLLNGSEIFLKMNPNGKIKYLKLLSTNLQNIRPA